MRVGEDGVGTPDEDEPAVLDVFGKHPHFRPHGRCQSRVTGAAADVAIQARGTEPCKKPPIEGVRLDHAHRTGKTVG